MPDTAPYDANFTVPERLHVDRLSFTADLVTIYASTTNPAAECPVCKQLSPRIHGCYTRTLADLPWCGTPVRLRVRVRKFFCDVPSCERRIFAERLEDVARAYARQQQTRRRHYELVLERWREIRRLQQAGADVTDIARKLGTSRPTLYRYKDLAEPPEFGQHRRKGSVLDPWVPYILRRWEEGCRNGHTLFREIREQGYPYSESNVARLVAELRRSDELTPDRGRRRSASDTAARAPGTRHVVSLFLRQPGNLTEDQAAYLDRLRASDEAVGAAYELSQRFAAMIGELGGERLEECLAQTESCDVPALRHFAARLKTDLAAVRAGLVESWNNGPVEGFINKLKLVKREGYSRANIDLLKARLMAA